MTAAIPQSTTGHHQWIPIAKLKPSPLNHRKTFNKEKMAELQASIAAHGVLQPILVRPLAADEFEVVAGERRFRAAKAARLADIPAIVRELTDSEALECQVIENGQREDPHPLEEAEGYEALMQCPRADGTKYSADEIAAKVGKSRSYVYGRLKLCALGPNGRKAFYKGLLDASRALLIARIPVPELQDKALCDILRISAIEDLDNEDVLADLDLDEVMSYRDAQGHLQWEYTLRLKEAPFKTTDANLVAAAGACTTCPKRSGNQPELFADLESADVCTDPKCFAQKRDAHLEQLASKEAAKGKEVVAPSKARGYVKLDDRVRGDPQYRTYRQLLGKNVEPALMPELTHDNKAKFVEIVKKADVKAVVDDKVAKAKAKRGGGNGPPGQEQQLERNIEQEYSRRLFAHVCAAAPVAPGKRELLYLVEDELDTGNCDTEAVAELLLPDAKTSGHSALRAALPKLDEAGLLRLLFILVISHDLSWRGDEGLIEIAKLYKIKPEAIQKAVRDELTAAASAAAPKPKKKEPAEVSA